MLMSREMLLSEHRRCAPRSGMRIPERSL